uniref:Uncharacterized protein n=1 Tax=Cacopsylla melanoneura TaxID=428564 RepID=A0A8D8VG53_9HEMI
MVSQTSRLSIIIQINCMDIENSLSCVLDGPPEKASIIKKKSNTLSIFFSIRNIFFFFFFFTPPPPPPPPTPPPPPPPTPPPPPPPVFFFFFFFPPRGLIEGTLYSMVLSSWKLKREGYLGTFTEYARYSS